MIKSSMIINRPYIDLPDNFREFLVKFCRGSWTLSTRDERFAMIEKYNNEQDFGTFTKAVYDLFIKNKDNQEVRVIYPSDNALRAHCAYCVKMGWDDVINLK